MGPGLRVYYRERESIIFEVEIGPRPSREHVITKLRCLASRVSKGVPAFLQYTFFF